MVLISTAGKHRQRLKDQNGKAKHYWHDISYN